MKTILFKIINFFGVYVEKLHSPKVFLNSLEKKPLIIKEYEIRKKTNFAAIVENHEYYNNLLKEDIPDWNLHIERAKFIGKGIGASSLDTFRKVYIDGKPFFEKVYFNSFPELENILWFQEHYYQELIKQIRTSKIEKVIKGNIMSVVYFEFLDLKPVTCEELEGSLIEISKVLYNLPLKENSEKFSILSIDFRKHFEYKRNIKTIKEDFIKLGISFEYFERRADSSSCVFTHGDIQKTNVFKEMTLIDWDSFGFFPVGFEQAFIYYRFLFEDIQCGLPLDWILKNYKNKISDNNWQDFERNFIYFLTIFSFSLFKENKHKNILLILINYLKKHND